MKRRRRGWSGVRRREGVKSMKENSRLRLRRKRRDTNSGRFDELAEIEILCVSGRFIII